MISIMNKQKIEQIRNLLNNYHNHLMDEFNGNASEIAIESFLKKEFKHIHVNNGKNDECYVCGHDLRDEIHSRN